MLSQFILWGTCIRDEFVSVFPNWMWKFLWSQFFITFELKFKHPSSYFDKLCSMLIIWMQGPFDSTLTRSQCRSECVPTTGNLVLVFQMRFDYCRQKQWLSLCAQSSCRSVTHQLPTVLSTGTVTALPIPCPAQAYRSPALCRYSSQHLWALPGDHRWQQSQHSHVPGNWWFVSQLQFKWRKIALFAPLWIISGYVSE